MTVRFFILQAHYRGTVDFSNEALKASETALKRLLEGWKRLGELKPSADSTVDVADLERRCYEAMDDDLNTPVVIATLFDACRVINQINDGTARATEADIEALKRLMQTFAGDILGITPEGDASEGALKPYEEAVDLLLDIRREAKKNKDWTTSDRIRDRLSQIGFSVKDTKDGGWEWSLK